MRGESEMVDLIAKWPPSGRKALYVRCGNGGKKEPLRFPLH